MYPPGPHLKKAGKSSTSKMPAIVWDMCSFPGGVYFVGFLNLDFRKYFVCNSMLTFQSVMESVGVGSIRGNTIVII